MKILKRYSYLITSYGVVGIGTMMLLRNFNIEIQILGFLIGIMIPIIPSIAVPLVVLNYLGMYLLNIEIDIGNFSKYVVNFDFISFIIGSLYSMIAQKIGYSIQSVRRVVKKEKESPTVIYVNGGQPTPETPKETIIKKSIIKKSIIKRKKLPNTINYNFLLNNDIRVKMDIIKKEKDNYEMDITILEFEKIDVMKKVKVKEIQVRNIIKLLNSHELKTYDERKKIMNEIDILYLQ